VTSVSSISLQEVCGVLPQVTSKETEDEGFLGILLAQVMIHPQWMMNPDSAQTEHLFNEGKKPIQVQSYVGQNSQPLMELKIIHIDQESQFETMLSGLPHQKVSSKQMMNDVFKISDHHTQTILSEMPRVESTLKTLVPLPMIEHHFKQNIALEHKGVQPPQAMPKITTDQRLDLTQIEGLEEIEVTHLFKPSEEVKTIVSKMVIEHSLKEHQSQPLEMKKQVVKPVSELISDVIHQPKVIQSPLTSSQEKEFAHSLVQLKETTFTQGLEHLMKHQDKEVTLKLKPEGIGEILIKMSTETKSIQVQLNLVSKELVHMVEKHIPRLEGQFLDYRCVIESSLSQHHFNQPQHSPSRQHASTFQHQDVEKEVLNQPQPALIQTHTMNQYA